METETYGSLWKFLFVGFGCGLTFDIIVHYIMQTVNTRLHLDILGDRD